MSGVGYHACLVPLALSQDKCPLPSLMRMRAKKILSPSCSSPSFCQRLQKAKWEINQAKHTSSAGYVLVAVASDLFGTHFYLSAQRGCYAVTRCSLPWALSSPFRPLQGELRCSRLEAACFLRPSPFPMSPFPKVAASGLGSEGGLW